MNCQQPQLLELVPLIVIFAFAVFVLIVSAWQLWRNSR